MCVALQGELCVWPCRGSGVCGLAGVMVCVASQG